MHMSARILVVEDEEALTTLLRYNLDAEGYDVETVGRGDDADTRLKERVPAPTVLDGVLPGHAGIEVCRRARARRSHRKAVLGAGIAGAGAGPASPRKSRTPRHGSHLRRYRTRSRETP